MENAFEALKMAFAVFVFVIALALAFSLLSQANATAKEIFWGMDTITYLDHEKYKGEHRSVGIETIIPTIYRYSIEQYAVTIIDKEGYIIARYDLEGENVAQSSLGNAILYKKNDPNFEIPKFYNAYISYSKYIDYVLTVLENLQSTSPEVTINYSSDSTTVRTIDSENYKYNEALDERLQALYSYTNEGNGEKYYGAPWQPNYFAERLKADLTGDLVKFQGNIYNPSGVFDGENSLKDRLEGHTFKEYVIEQDKKYRVKDYKDQVNDTSPDKEDSGSRDSMQLEIFYIEE